MVDGIFKNCLLGGEMLLVARSIGVHLKVRVTPYLAACSSLAVRGCSQIRCPERLLLSTDFKPLKNTKKLFLI